MKVVHIISGGDSGGAKTHLFALTRELVKNIDMKIVCFIEGEFYKEAVKLGFPVVLIKQNKRTDAFFSKELLDFIEKEKPDIIHTHGARANFSILLNAKKIKCPLITTIHSDYRQDFKDNLIKYLIFTPLNKLALGIFDYYIGVSPEFKKMLISRGYPKNRIYSVFNGIDFNEQYEVASKDEFMKKYNLEIDEDKIIFGNLSRLEEVKAVDVFIKGAAKALEENPNLHFVIAGDGTQKEKLEALTRELGIQKNVSFLGFIKDATSFLNFIDVNCITSHSESFTYSLLEGARQEKATISSRVGGLVNLIKDDETGILFEDNDIEGLKKAMLKYASDEKYRKEMANGLYHFTKEHFSTENMAKSHIDIYSEVITRGKK